MNKKSETKSVLITGASSGIGREIALKLAKSGWKVFAGVRNKIDKTELEALNNNIIGVYIDVTNSAGIEKAFWYVMKNTHRLDVLINNAGIVTAGPMEYLPVGKIKEQFNVNSFGPVAVTQQFMPLLTNSKVINISSMAATGIFPYIAPYCASKRAMEILMNNLGIENKDNIKVVFVRPAAIKTPIWNKSAKFATEIFNDFSDVAKKKYENDFKMLSDNVLVNNKTGIDPIAVVDKIIDIIKTENPKPVYTVGMKAFWTEVLSKCSYSFINKGVRWKLRKLLNAAAKNK